MQDLNTNTIPKSFFIFRKPVSLRNIDENYYM